MPAVRASVLIIGHPNPETIAFGADFAETFDKARVAVREFHYPVIVLPSSQSVAEQALSLLDFASSASPLSQRVIIQNDTPAESLRKMINTGSVFRILGSFYDPGFDLTIQEALEEYRLLKQNANLLQLVNEQNERLRKLTTDLEERVEARRKSLEEAKEKLLVTNHRIEALHRALVAIHRAGSIAEMERLINEALSSALGLSWTRILFHSQAKLEWTAAATSGSALGLGMGSTSSSASSHASSLASRLALHNAPLMRGKEMLGHIYFARGAEHPFSRDETGFLGQIADAVSLAIDRLTKLEQSETLKHQWEATFDAILDPVSLITSDCTLVRINRSYADRSGADPEKVIGRKCYEALFARTSPCEGCSVQKAAAQQASIHQAAASQGSREGQNFRLKPGRTAGGANVIYDVFSQEIRFKTEDRSLFVNMYHDVSAQLRLERQILESAKMAELGTIGSSIAHELNNPLGGMLSFLQLIKMDLGNSLGPAKESATWAEDIDEMEKGARRCRDIVQSLLGFTRKSSVDTIEVIDLCEVIEQALKITELQTRAMGLKIVQELPDQPIEMRGQFNALAQALRNFLQNAQEAIAERLRKGSSQATKVPGEIRVRASVTESEVSVEIIDNGTGFDTRIGDQIYDPTYTTKDPVSNPGLGLTVAQQIVKDHGGRVDISSVQGSGTSAKISFPRPVFDP